GGGQGVGGDGGGGGGGDVVEGEGKVHRLRHRVEVAIETFLGRLVVVGIDHEGARGPRLLGVAGEVDRFRGSVGPCPRDDVEPAARRLDDDLDHAPVLVVAQGR